MGWRLLQAAVFMAMASANIHWQWTDNGYLASVWAGMAAFAVTWLVANAMDLFGRWRKPPLAAVGEQRGDDRGLLRADSRHASR